MRKDYEFRLAVGSQSLCDPGFLDTVENMKQQLFFNDLAWKLKETWKPSKGGL